MAYSTRHTHPCANAKIGCTARIPCHGRPVTNGDCGKLCEYELEAAEHGYTELDWQCEECATGPCCEDCGYPEHLGHAEGCEADQTATASG